MGQQESKSTKITVSAAAIDPECGNAISMPRDYCKDATAAMPALRFDVALVDASSDCRVTESTVTAKYLKGTAQKLAL